MSGYGDGSGYGFGYGVRSGQAHCKKDEEVKKNEKN